LQQQTNQIGFSAGQIQRLVDVIGGEWAVSAQTGARGTAEQAFPRRALLALLMRLLGNAR
jgi:hypothetical protein